MDSVEQYIDHCDSSLHIPLTRLRQTILSVSPAIQEKIAWGVPTYMYHGFLVQFAVNKKHIGFYCSPEAIRHFQKELTQYHTNTKNTIHFPLTQELPYSLIQEIVQYRIKENDKSAD